MSLNARTIKQAKSKGFVEQPLLEVAVYPARVVQMIDLGLQDGGEWKGEKKSPVNKIHVTYELVDSFLVDADGAEVEDKPRWVSEELKIFSPDVDKANCNKRYQAIDPDLVHDYNWAEVITNPCNVMIIHKESKGKTYANVGTITPYIVSKRNPELVPLQNEAKVFDLAEPDMDVFESLPQWIKDKIVANLEFKGSPLDKALNGSAPKVKAEEESVEVDDIEEDDIPW